MANTGDRKLIVDQYFDPVGSAEDGLESGIYNVRWGICPLHFSLNISLTSELEG